MTTFTCDNFRPVHIGDETRQYPVEKAQDAAFVFADRLARRQYGKRGYCHHVRCDCVAMDGRYANYEAFIGVDVEGGGTQGYNVWLTVYSDPPKPSGSLAAWE